MEHQMNLQTIATRIARADLSTRSEGLRRSDPPTAVCGIWQLVLEAGRPLTPENAPHYFVAPTFLALCEPF